MRKFYGTSVNGIPFDGKGNVEIVGGSSPNLQEVFDKDQSLGTVFADISESSDLKIKASRVSLESTSPPGKLLIGDCDTGKVILSSAASGVEISSTGGPIEISSTGSPIEIGKLDSVANIRLKSNSTIDIESNNQVSLKSNGSNILIRSINNGVDISSPEGYITAMSKTFLGLETYGNLILRGDDSINVSGGNFNIGLTDNINAIANRVALSERTFNSLINLDSDGKIYINGTNGASLSSGGEFIISSNDLKLSKFTIEEFEVSTLPITSESTLYATVTDALDPINNQEVIGGGTSKVPVFFNGSEWVALVGGSSDTGGTLQTTLSGGNEATFGPYDESYVRFIGPSSTQFNGFGVGNIDGQISNLSQSTLYTSITNRVDNYRGLININQGKIVFNQELELEGEEFSTNLSFEDPISISNLKFPAKNTGDYTLATTSDFKTINGESIVGTSNIHLSLQ